jgi:hypothetical protein
MDKLFDPTSSQNYNWEQVLEQFESLGFESEEVDSVVAHTNNSENEDMGDTLSQPDQEDEPLPLFSDLKQTIHDLNNLKLDHEGSSEDQGSTQIDHISNFCENEDYQND